MPASIIPVIPTGTELTAILVVVCFSAGINIYATGGDAWPAGTRPSSGSPCLPSLDLLRNWYCLIGICAVLFVVEFISDKIPVFDLLWNALHTFVRIPAAALLTYAATAQLPEWERALATLAGGSIAPGSPRRESGGAGSGHRFARAFLE